MRLASPLLLLALACACTPSEAAVDLPTTKEPLAPAAKPNAATASTASTSSSASTGSVAAAPPVEYGWLNDAKAVVPKAHDTLLARFSPPAGFLRVPVEAKSFGAFLRTLPLAAPGTPVLTYKGNVLHEATHPNVAAVVAIDVGKADLQQCADSVIRLHAEWLWSIGRRDQAYSTAGGPKMSFAKWLAGERWGWDAGKLVPKKVAPVAATHEGFRSWLDEVFGAANTASLAKEAKPIEVADVRPGDFVVMSGVPFGHAVLVLDVARASDGRRVLLLGQGYMPAQSFHVLRPNAKEVWFPLDEASGKLKTPFWEPFPFSALRRLD